MSAVSFGIPSNNRNPSSTDPLRFEMLGVGPKDMINMPIPPFDSLNTGAGYPTKLKDGYFFTLKTFSGSEYGADATVGGPWRMDRGTQFYDYAPDATTPVYLYFSANENVSNGANENPRYLDSPTNSIENPNWEPGANYSEAITGFLGLFDAWVPADRTAEGVLSGYTVGTKVTVFKGKNKIATSGQPYVGTVIENYNNVKVRIRYNLTASQPVA